MKDTILYELEYDENGNPDIRVTMKTKKTNMVFRMKDIVQPDFEDLPVNIQLEKLNELTVNAIKALSEGAKEEITSLKNANNRRNFPLEVMEAYASIVKEMKENKKSSRYWKEALDECVNYTKKNYPNVLNGDTSKKNKKDLRTLYEDIDDMKPEPFRKMMEDYFKKHPR